MIGLNRDTSMGHLVAGGSIANIEAIWVARNLKYYPLGLQEALLKEEQLRGARGYEVGTVICMLHYQYGFDLETQIPPTSTKSITTRLLAICKL